MALSCLGVASSARGQAAAEPAPSAEDKAPKPAAGGVVSQPKPGEVCLYCDPDIESPRGRSGLHWHDHWSRVGLSEAFTIAAATSVYVTTLFIKPDDDADWTGPILFDTPVRKSLRLGTREERQAAASVSDALLFGSIAHPTIVDNFLVTLLGRQSPEVAWQMFVINTQAYALTLSVNAVTKRVVARGRPYTGECESDPNYSGNCDSDSQFKSFYSGHAAVTATGAGLLCAHHTQLELYGDPTLDSATCALGIMMTAATGALRISSDNHWTSDVLVGHLMGYASGYLMPTLLYYHEFRTTPEPPDAHSPPVVASRATIVPMVTDTSFQLRLVGMF